MASPPLFYNRSEKSRLISENLLIEKSSVLKWVGIITEKSVLDS
ncbi:hypothetical protein RDI58_016645 [Solanum bulbocastanum]|uniref:Uncharacterized protein n=1 Tax=Solanum bulbocastanum TaxID=147425 RepID=A0AAN8THW0_SOLBU